MVQATSKTGSNRGHCTTETLSCNSWTAKWFSSAPKLAGQTDQPYFDPWLSLDSTETSLCISFDLDFFEHQNKTKVTNLIAHGKAISSLFKCLC